MNKSSTSSAKKVTFTDAKAGDPVWSLTEGWGVVIERSSPHTRYPLTVQFENGTHSYTLWGRFRTSDLNPTLFWDEVKIETPEKPLPDLEVDTKVMVWKDRGLRTNRHFSHFDHRGVMHTFADGRTSFTGSGSTVPWTNWELPESPD